MNIILFDFDGVIVDTFSFCYSISNLRQSVTEEEYRARFEGNINDAIKKVDQVSPPKKPFDFFGLYTPKLMDRSPVKGIADVILELARTHTLIIISSTTSAPISAFLEAHGLRTAFKEILGNDVEKSKVKKIQDVLNRYSIQPTETVFITDTLGDIKEANACGVRSIAVTWGFHPVKTLEKGSPYKIIERPEEILESIPAVFMDR